MEELAEDDSFLAHMQRVNDRYEKRVADNVEPYNSLCEEMGPVAYFQWNSVSMKIFLFLPADWVSSPEII